MLVDMKVDKNLTFGKLWELYLATYQWVKIYADETSNCLYYGCIEDMQVVKYFKLMDLVVDKICSEFDGPVGAYLVIHLKGDDSND